MKIGDMVFIHGYIDEIRKDTVIIRNKGGYFGTIQSEVICGKIPERKTGKWVRHYSRPNVYADLCWHCSNCGYKTPDNWANKWKFCPNCGVRMMQEGEDND